MNGITSSALANKNALLSVQRSAIGEKVKSVNAALSLAKIYPTPCVEPNPMPQLATPNDLRDLIRFLKLRPDGVSLVEALGEMKKRLLEPQKIQAYERWGIISTEENYLRLSALGWEFANKLAIEASLFCAILDSIKPYRAILELTQAQQLNLLVEDDVVRFWRANFPDFIQSLPVREIESGVVSFLHLCHAAELGSLTIGKRGQPARLRVDLEALNAYLSATPRELIKLQPTAPNYSAKNQAAKIRVSISVSNGEFVVAPLLQLFSLLNIEGELIVRGQQETLLNSERNFAALRSCDAGVLILTLADCLQSGQGNFELTPEAQMEISAAYLFYNRKIVLLRDARIQLPNSWQSVQCCEFNEQGINWENGLSLTNAILQFVNE